MADTNLTQFLTEIADEIRYYTNTEEEIPASEFANKIGEVYDNGEKVTVDGELVKDKMQLYTTSYCLIDSIAQESLSKISGSFDINRQNLITTGTSTRDGLNIYNIETNIKHIIPLTKAANVGFLPVTIITYKENIYVYYQHEDNDIEAYYLDKIDLNNMTSQNITYFYYNSDYDMIYFDFLNQNIYMLDSVRAGNGLMPKLEFRSFYDAPTDSNTVLYTWDKIETSLTNLSSSQIVQEQNKFYILIGNNGTITKYTVCYEFEYDSNNKNFFIDENRYDIIQQSFSDNKYTKRYTKDGELFLWCVAGTEEENNNNIITYKYNPIERQYQIKEQYLIQGPITTSNPISVIDGPPVLFYSNKCIGYFSEQTKKLEFYSFEILPQIPNEVKNSLIRIYFSGMTKITTNYIQLQIELGNWGENVTSWYLQIIVPFIKQSTQLQIEKTEIV